MKTASSLEQIVMLWHTGYLPDHGVIYVYQITHLGIQTSASAHSSEAIESAFRNVNLAW